MSGRSRKRSTAGRAGPKKQREVQVAARKRSSGHEVKWHKEAREEHLAIGDAPERVAIQNVIEKLKVDGAALRAPHQSGIKGSAGEGLRELRPRQGRSRWRPIYRRIGEIFVILAVATEAEIDSAGYDRQVGEAQKRRRAVEEALGS